MISCRNFTNTFKNVKLRCDVRKHIKKRPNSICNTCEIIVSFYSTVSVETVVRLCCNPSWSQRSAALREASRKAGVRKSLHPSSKLIPAQAIGSDFRRLVLGCIRTKLHEKSHYIAYFVALFKVYTIIFMTFMTSADFHTILQNFL
jgi:hypothetical protein